MPLAQPLTTHRWLDTAGREAGVAMLVSALALGSRWLLDPWLGHHHPLLPTYAAIALATWFGSWRAGALTAIICQFGVIYFLVTPPDSIEIVRPDNHVAVASFYLVAAVIIYLGHRATSANKSLSDLVKRLGEADHRKSEFLALLAHELRNPLSTMTVAHGLIKSGALAPAALQGTWDRLERQTNHMTRLVGDLLDVARIDQGKMILRRISIPVATAVNDAVDVARSLAASKRQTVAVEMPDDPGTVVADPVRMSQILANLLHNASKFSPEGGVIKVKVEPAAEQVTISVKDPGIGIPASQLLAIFESFVQLAPRSNGPQGLGLGLALTKKLIEMHGGSVEARSQGVGMGSEFIARFPRGEVSWEPVQAPQSSLFPEQVEPLSMPAPVQQADPAQPPPVRQQFEPLLAPPSGAAKPAALRLLVVDDNRDAAETLAMLLDLKGYQVRTAHDGRSALRAMVEQQSDFVFLDIGLPDMSGHEVALQLRRQVKGKQPVLVALTGWGNEEDRKRSRESGFDLHLTKPVSIESIDEALTKARPTSSRLSVEAPTCGANASAVLAI
jgi:signal transduction histidine kinase/ActR/RegA family two-component response regulator